MDNKNSDENCHFHWLESIDSTNRYAIKHFDDFKDMTFVLAKEQTAGRGRRGKSWLSPKGLNFYGSLIIKNNKYLPHEMVWPGSLAALELLREYSPQSELWLKWPNDIYCESKKIAGVLCEGKLNSSNKLEGIIFGIGINLNMDQGLLASIDKPATSLFHETGNQIDIEKFAFELGKKVKSLYHCAFSAGFENFFRLWKAENKLIGNDIEVLSDRNKVIKGKVVDINSNAELELETADGKIQQFSSGDVTIKEGFRL